MKRTKIFTALALALLGLAGLAAAQRAKMIQIKGSDTMVNLVQILAEEYMGKNPGAAIAVLGGGSGTGITGLINQTCDIANSSREWKPKEIDQAWDKGVTPRPFVVAVDGLSIIVNEKNPIARLTVAQVGALYRGEIKNWKAVGEFAKPVSLYGRQSNSGTYVFMQEFVLGNKNYSTDMKEMNGNAQIIEGVIQDEGGRRLRRRRLPLRREGPGPQGPQGPQDLQGARRARPICRPTRRPSTPAITRSPGPSTWPPTASPRATRPSSWPGSSAPRARPSSSARVSSRSAKASTRPPTTRTSSEVDGPAPDDIESEGKGSDRAMRRRSSRPNIKEAAIKAFFFTCGVLAVLVLVGIFLTLLATAVPAFREIRLSRVPGETRWDPTSPEKAEYGILSMIVSTLLVTAGALLLAVPIGIGVAAYLSDVAHWRVREIAQAGRRDPGRHPLRRGRLPGHRPLRARSWPRSSTRATG